MTFFMPTCEEVTALLTDLDEGSLGPLAWLGVRTHLALCPPCRLFLGSLARTSTLLREIRVETPCPAAESALQGALALLRQGRGCGPLHHPAPEDWARADSGNPPGLELLLRFHLGLCDTCRTTHGTDRQPLLPEPGDFPEALAEPLSPMVIRRWTRFGLGGVHLARIEADAQAGTSLFLVEVPGGCEVPAHEHRGLECSVILRGQVQDGPARLGPGDWIAHAPGVRHAPATDPGAPCWCLVYQEAPARFLGWRGLLPGLL